MVKLMTRETCLEKGQSKYINRMSLVLYKKAGEAGDKAKILFLFTYDWNASAPPFSVIGSYRRHVHRQGLVPNCRSRRLPSHDAAMGVVSAI